MEGAIVCITDKGPEFYIYIYIYVYVTAVARVFNAAETSLTCHREGHLFGYSNSGVQGVQGNCVFSDFGFA